MTRTFLRIKRRRTEDPFPFIRLEALNHPSLPPYHQHPTKKRGRLRGDGNVADVDSENLSDYLEHHEEAPQYPAASLLWKRLEPSQEEAESCRIVDALLEQENEHDVRLNKRRRLTLLDTSNNTTNKVPDTSTASSSTSRKAALKVFDPVTRMVDDSLQQVHRGTRTIAEHYRFITTDRRLVSSYDTKRWLLWSHSSGGNILHACALWNEMEMAAELLQIPNLAGPLCEAVDGDGRTPYEVAQLSGHDSVCQVLEAFGCDTSNFVYDIFCLEEGDNELLHDEKYAPTTVELTSGVAYWTPNGELMLEANDRISAYVDDEEGEIDSNCEDYDANDYPDDEEEDEDAAWGYEDAHNFETELLNHD